MKMGHAINRRVNRKSVVRARFAILLIILAQLWGGHLHLSFTHAIASPNTVEHHPHEVQIHVQTNLEFVQSDLEAEGEMLILEETDIASTGVVKKSPVSIDVFVFLLVPLLILLTIVNERRLFSRRIAQIFPPFVLPHWRPLSRAPPR